LQHRQGFAGDKPELRVETKRAIVETRLCGKLCFSARSLKASYRIRPHLCASTLLAWRIFIMESPAGRRSRRRILDCGDSHRNIAALKSDNLHPEHTYKTALIECDADMTPVVCQRQVSGDYSEPVCIRTWPRVGRKS
jgi:hypothetical protein